MPYFLLSYELSDDYFERRDPFKAEHMRHIAEATESRSLIMAGAIGMPLSSAAYVFAGEGAAEDFARSDPYVAAGIVTRWSVAPWHPIAGPGAS